MDLLRRPARAAAALILSGLATGACAGSATDTVLHAFHYADLNDGSLPVALVQGNDGNFYGVTEYGGYLPGGLEAGTVFKITPGGTESVIYTFDGQSTNGSSPTSLIKGSDGNFYGITFYGGPADCAGSGGAGAPSCGAIFKTTPAGTTTFLHTFQGGSNDGFAVNSLTQGADGNLYGTTEFGGSGNCPVDFDNPLGGCGIVFKITPQGTFSILVSFQSSGNLTYPNHLFQGHDGYLYGLAGDTSNSPATHLFKMTTSGTESIVYNFTSPDSSVTAILQATDGNFYGVSNLGGTAGNGSVFRITPAGIKTELHSFTGNPDGVYPVALIQAGDSNLYGVTRDGGTAGDGTIFKITTSGTETVLSSFQDNPDGRNPVALLQASDASLYGVTAYGGGGNDGTVFKLDVGAGVPAAPSLSATAGNKSVQLSWSAVSNATSYDVYQSTIPGGEGSTPVLTGITATGTSISGLENGSTYYFKVTAVDAAGQSAQSNEASATPSASGSGVPDAPQNLSAIAGNRTVTLNWSASADATSYTVYQSTTPFGENFSAVLTGISGTSATLTKLTNGTTYYFTVIAVGSNGDSDEALDVSATPALIISGDVPAAPAALSVASTGTAGSVVVSWPLVSAADSYSLYQGDSAGGESSVPVQTQIVAAANATVASATVTGLAAGRSYYFKVSSIGNGGQSAPSTEATITIPTTITGSKSGGGGAIDPWTLLAMAGLTVLGRRRIRRPNR